jgi:hypothetical protein
VVLFLFDLDLKIYLNGLENKCKKGKSLCAAGSLEAHADWPALLFSQVGRAEPSFFLPPAPSGLA